MKKILPLCLIIFFTAQVFAQQQFDSEKAAQILKLEKARTQKITGRTLTIAGGVLVGIGVIVGANSSETTYSTTGGPTYTTSQGNLGLAVASFYLGMAGLGVGIPVWSVGAHREKKLKSSQGVSLTVIPGTNGLTLRCRF